MTIAINPVATPIRRSDPDRAGLRQAMRAEWTKLMSLRSTKLTLVITLAVCVLGTFLTIMWARERGRHKKARAAPPPDDSAKLREPPNPSAV